MSLIGLRDGCGLKSVHPGVSLERIKRKTAFQLDVADDLGETSPPDEEDLRLLRDEIDPLATRKLETLAGGARKELLREILRREAAPSCPSPGPLAISSSA